MDPDRIRIRRAWWIGSSAVAVPGLGLALLLRNVAGDEHAGYLVMLGVAISAFHGLVWGAIRLVVRRTSWEHGFPVAFAVGAWCGLLASVLAVVLDGDVGVILVTYPVVASLVTLLVAPAASRRST